MYEGACIRQGIWFITRSRLLAANPRLAGLFLQIVQFFLGGIERLLFAVNLVLLFACIFGELGLVAQHGPGIAIICRRAQPRFARRYVQFALQRGNLFFLSVNLFLQFFALFLGVRRVFFRVLGFRFFGAGALVVGLFGSLG